MRDLDPRQGDRHGAHRQAGAEPARRDEAARQHRQQVRLVDDARRGRELVHRQDDAAFPAERGQPFVDEAARPSGEADADVPGGAIVVECQQGLGGERVIAPHDADVLAAVERLEHGHRPAALGGELLRDGGEEAEREVGAALLEQRARVARDQRQHAQVDPRVTADQRRDQRRHEHGRGRVGHRQREAALVEGRLEPLRIEDLAQGLERGAHLRPPGLGLRGRHDAARHGDEQLVAGRLAQAPEGVADRRLGHRQLRRRPGDVALDHDGAEHAQQVEVERAEVHGRRAAFTAVMGGCEMAISIGLGKTLV